MKNTHIQGEINKTVKISRLAPFIVITEEGRLTFIHTVNLDKPTVKHGKDIHAPFCTKICNETSLDLKTVAKVVVSIDIKQHI